MNAHSFTLKTATGLLAGSLLIGTPAAAMAGSTTPSAVQPSTPASGPAFTAAKKAVEHLLALRQVRLSTLTKEVIAAKGLTVSDRSTLEARLADETSGINGLAGKVPTDTTWKELGTDAKQMVVDYRLFAVMSPQVHLAISADTEHAVENVMQDLEPSLASAIKHAESKGMNVRPAKIAYAGLLIQVANARHDSTGVATAVLATAPAGYPGNETVFVNARSSLVQGRTALVTARSDLQTIVTTLGL